jgi:hypothetical protein
MERGRRGNLLAFGMQDREAAGTPLRAEHTRTDTATLQGSPSDPCGMVPSSAMGGRSDKHPMALEEAQASVPSRACPSPGRRGPIPAATSNACADLWTFRSGRDQGPTGRRGASWPKRGWERSECLPASVGRRPIVRDRPAPPIGVLSQSKPSQSEPSQSACNSGETRHTLANARRKGRRDARLSDQRRVLVAWKFMPPKLPRPWDGRRDRDAACPLNPRVSGGSRPKPGAKTLTNLPS